MKVRLTALHPFLVEPRDLPSSGDPKPGAARSFLQLTCRIAVLLAAFVILHQLLQRIFQLPESSYHRGFLLWECLRHRWIILVPALILAGLSLAAVPRLRQGWTQFELGTSLRWFVGVLCIILAWEGSAYPYNAYYGQSHLADRLVLAALAALVFWRPVFALPFVACFWLLIWQFNFPTLGFSSFQGSFMPPLQVVTLFCAIFLLRTLLGSRGMNDFLFLALCVVAAYFWIPGLAKLRIGWISHGHVYYLFPAAYTHGWLGFLQPESVESVTKFLAAMDWPMRIGTLMIECGALFMFLHARSAKWLLILLTLLLGSIFLTIGYFFWKWMCLHALLLSILFFKSRPQAEAIRQALFTPQRFALSLLVILCAPLWCSPPWLAWFDTPVTNTLRYEAVGKSGQTYSLPLDVFGAYSSQMAMSSFTYKLTSEPVLTAPYGITFDRSLAVRLVSAPDAGAVRTIEAEPSRSTPLNENDATQLHQFITRHISHINRSLPSNGSSGPHSLLNPPNFLWTSPQQPAYQYQEPIDSLNIFHLTSFYNRHTHSYTLLHQYPLTP